MYVPRGSYIHIYTYPYRGIHKNRYSSIYTRMLGMLYGDTLLWYVPSTTSRVEEAHGYQSGNLGYILVLVYRSAYIQPFSYSALVLYSTLV